MAFGMQMTAAALQIEQVPHEVGPGLGNGLLELFAGRFIFEDHDVKQGTVDDHGDSILLATDASPDQPKDMTAPLCSVAY